MGWGNCGEDSKGRPIGYYHAGTCDHPGCDKQIDRGLSYACGGMHGLGTTADDLFVDYVCEGYFCGEHLSYPCLEHEDGAEFAGDIPQMCPACLAKVEDAYRNDHEWREHWPTDEPPLTPTQPNEE